MIGGNWRYENDNGTSSAYRSLHINSARKLMSYRAFPMPEEYPDYPSHFQIAKYFDAYAKRFGLLERITFRSEVVAPARRGEQHPPPPGAGGGRRGGGGGEAPGGGGGGRPPRRPPRGGLRRPPR